MQEFAKKSVSIDEFEKIKAKDGEIYELIDGIVVMSRPNINHQRILTNLSGELYLYFKGRTCKNFSEIEVKLNNDILVPDISIICDFTKLSNQRYDDAPVIVIEILSPSTMFNDFNIKSNKYLVAGCKEYWIVDPEHETIIINDFTNKTIDTFEIDDVLKTNVFEDLNIMVEDVFE